MDTATGAIPDFSLVQVSETTSSPVMELLGFQRSLANIEAADLSVDVVVTDRMYKYVKKWEQTTAKRLTSLTSGICLSPLRRRS
jgi:hypothetical protein